MIIWLTGAIGSGKSAAAAILRALGATTVDLDAVVHDLHTHADVRARVANALQLPAGYSRADVAAVVFQDAARLQQLESILHPLVWEVARIRDNAADSVVAIEMPLPPRVMDGDVVICLEASEATRLRRLLQRGMALQDLQARMAAAPTPDSYRAGARYVVTNDRDAADLELALRPIWNEVTHAAG